MGDNAAAQIRELEAELRALRTSHRRLQKAGLAVIVVGLLVASLAARRGHDERVLEAEKLILRDSEGNPRIIMKVDTKETASIGLYDDQGNLRMKAFTQGPNGGSGLIVSDANAVQRLGFGVTPSGLTGLTLYSSTGRDQVHLGVSNSLGSYLTLGDDAHSARLRLQVPTDAKQYPSLLIVDADDTELLKLPRRPAEAFHGE